MHDNNSSIPVCDCQGFYFDGKEPVGLVNGDAQAKEKQPLALFSVLQFGAIVPPLSPWKGIRRLRPGYYHQGGHELEAIKFKFDGEGTEEALAEDFLKRFDNILLRNLRANTTPVVLFSGGVDSGLIAARLAQLGRTDTLLLNYSFGEDDAEAHLAKAMAAKLGLRFESFSSRKDFCACLEQPGKVYNFPFGDSSSVPTYVLAKSAVERLAGAKCVLFDGTGADGCFGMTQKIAQWQSYAKLPKMATRSASWLYARFGLWHEVGKLEYRLRLLKRLNDMPLLSAILAQNPLAGVLYAADGRGEVDDLLDSWVSGWAGDSLLRKTIGGDLALTCANTFAQKAYPILQRAGLKVVYPFMEDEMVEFSLAVAPLQGASEKKALLKVLLVQHVPREMVYRPKSGFVDIKASVFYEADFIEMLWAATEETSVFSGLVFKSPVRRVCDMLREGKRLPDQLYNCIWALVFTDRWYRTV